MTATYDVVNPATEEVVTTVGLTSLEETDAAIERAAAAVPAWRAVAPGDRGRLLRRFAELGDAAEAGCGAFVQAVKGGEYPAAEHTFA